MTILKYFKRNLIKLRDLEFKYIFIDFCILFSTSQQIFSKFIQHYNSYKFSDYSLYSTLKFN